MEALQKQDYVDYLLDVLLSPDMEERAAFIIDCGKEVSNLERRMAVLLAWSVPSSFGVLRHKIPLVFFEIPLHGGAESQLEPAASVNLHRFCPHLFDIGSGSGFVLQNVNLGLLRVHHDRDKAAVAGTVKGLSLIHI